MCIHWKYMEVLMMAMVFSLSVSADMLACGFCTGASRIRVPMVSAIAAAVVCALFVAVGMTAGNTIGALLPEAVQKYISFGVLAVLGLVKLAGNGENKTQPDCNRDKRLSIFEGVALGAALSVDGLAAGFGWAASTTMIVWSSVFTFAFSAAALYLGAKSGQCVRGGRWGNIAAGLALVVLAALKLALDL